MANYGRKNLKESGLDKETYIDILFILELVTFIIKIKYKNLFQIRS